MQPSGREREREKQNQVPLSMMVCADNDYGTDSTRSANHGSMRRHGTNKPPDKLQPVFSLYRSPACSFSRFLFPRSRSSFKFLQPLPIWPNQFREFSLAVSDFCFFLSALATIRLGRLRSSSSSSSSRAMSGELIYCSDPQ